MPAEWQPRRGLVRHRPAASSAASTFADEGSGDLAKREAAVALHSRMEVSFLLQRCVKLYTDSGETVWEGCGKMGEGPAQVPRQQRACAQPHRADARVQLGDCAALRLVRVSHGRGVVRLDRLAWRLAVDQTCRSAAPPSTSSRRLNRDGESAPAEWQPSRRRLPAPGSGACPSARSPPTARSSGRSGRRGR